MWELLLNSTIGMTVFLGGNHISFNGRFLRLDMGEVLWTATAARAGQQDYNVLLHEICKEIAENLKKQNAIRKIK